MPSQSQLQVSLLVDCGSPHKWSIKVLQVEAQIVIPNAGGLAAMRIVMKLAILSAHHLSVRQHAPRSTWLAADRNAILPNAQLSAQLVIASMVAALVARPSVRHQSVPRSVRNSARASAAIHSALGSATRASVRSPGAHFSVEVPKHAVLMGTSMRAHHPSAMA